MALQKMLVLVLMPLFAIAVACGGGETPQEPLSSETTPAVTPVDEATAGNLAGTVALEGTPPAAEQIRMNSDPVCLKEATDTETEYFAVGNDGGLGNVFVYVKEGLDDRSFPAPSESLTLTQEGCRYQPHVFGIQVGQTLEVLNGDPTLHNIHATPELNDEFNTGQPIEGMKFERTFTSAEVMVPFRCDVHGWMNAYAGVLNHPYFAVSDNTGAFDISTLPPGNYVIEAWHEKLGTQTQNVTIGENETKEISFQFSVS